MSIRRRKIATRLAVWLVNEPDKSEKFRRAYEVLESSSRMGRYLSYNIQRLSKKLGGTQ